MSCHSQCSNKVYSYWLICNCNWVDEILGIFSKVLCLLSCMVVYKIPFCYFLSVPSYIALMCDWPSLFISVEGLYGFCLHYNNSRWQLNDIINMLLQVSTTVHMKTHSNRNFVNFINFSYLLYSKQVDILISCYKTYTI